MIRRRMRRRIGAKRNDGLMRLLCSAKIYCGYNLDRDFKIIRLSL